MPKKSTEVSAKGGNRGISRTQKEVRTLLRKYDHRLDEVIDALFDDAVGIKVETEEGEVYSRPPDKAAAKILLEYRFGRPSSVDSKEEGGHKGGTTYNFINVQHQAARLPAREATETDYEEVKEKKTE